MPGELRVLGNLLVLLSIWELWTEILSSLHKLNLQQINFAKYVKAKCQVSSYL